MQKTLIGGVDTSASAARVNIQTAATEQYGNSPDYEKIRRTACGNVVATKRALNRAKSKRFLKIDSLEALKANPGHLEFTLRGRR
jgi:hypothetical protein